MLKSIVPLSTTRSHERSTEAPARTTPHGTTTSLVLDTLREYRERWHHRRAAGSNRSNAATTTTTTSLRSAASPGSSGHPPSVVTPTSNETSQAIPMTSAVHQTHSDIAGSPPLITVLPSPTPPTGRHFFDLYDWCPHRPVVGRGATSIVRLARPRRSTNTTTYRRNTRGTDVSNPDLDVVAVKETRKCHGRWKQTDLQFAKTVAAEFCIQSSLRHPNIVSVLDLVQLSNDRWCFIQEYCPGGDLHSRIRCNAFCLREANLLLIQLLKAVAYLHSLGVAHRDLKPENLLFDAHGQLKITDFGSAEVVRQYWESQVRETYGQAGSLPYMAPEMFDATVGYDARKADIWSCGVIYATMRLGRRPWDAADPSKDADYAAYVAAHAAFPSLSTSPNARDLLSLLSQISNEETMQLVVKILSPNPKERPHAKSLLEEPCLNHLES